MKPFMSQLESTVLAKRRGLIGWTSRCRTSSWLARLVVFAVASASTMTMMAVPAHASGTSTCGRYLNTNGAIYLKYVSLGGSTGPMGCPTTNETQAPDHVGYYAYFANGFAIYWTGPTGPHEVQGTILRYWASLGWERSGLGYPVSDEQTIPNTNGDRYSMFQNGAISWNHLNDTASVGTSVSQSASQIQDRINSVIGSLNLPNQVDGNDVSYSVSLGSPTDYYTNNNATSVGWTRNRQLVANVAFTVHTPWYCANIQGNVQFDANLWYQPIDGSPNPGSLMLNFTSYHASVSEGGVECTAPSTVINQLKPILDKIVNAPSRRVLDISNYIVTQYPSYASFLGNIHIYAVQVESNGSVKVFYEVA